MTEPTDEFDDPRGSGAISRLLSGLTGRLRARGPLVTVIAVAVLLLVLGGVVWATYPGKAPDPSAVPLIRADTTPYRALPDDPGGMQIPYRDSTVFNALHADATTTPAASANAIPPGDKIENLLPQPEQPLPRTKLFPDVKPDAAKPDVAATAPAAGTPTTSASAPATTATPAPAPAPSATPTASAPAPAQITPQDITSDPVTKSSAPPLTVKAQPAPAAKPADAAAPAPKATKVKPTVQSGGAAPAGYYVQLGSTPSADDAQASWKRAQSAYGQLSGLSLHIEKADLGARGIHYRVQTGPLGQQQAKDLCAAINAKKAGGCLVAKH